ncbi:MAG: ATP-binding cassette domain-containing protein [Hydrotalea flava]|uniref:ABC transporter ATP-binding protein n=1 Tax=Hydrotalea lipotrueae TaxID=2803817 RepID=UPI0016923DDA|nr:ABC transporter ATP-binding protein [Hydrotalea lipotrueae]NIM34391.1 ATP-binding cassette domain-containing protein [Hydrotalea flava]NIM37217.1 ATP-binding cassette domain-containing protein [Hydrotalea flava]NIN02410.1 ATP-binding cassette domain-containing protein [Hydrotalea flava]NIN14062.1 ATP-binding cassette domain-containing protein [Hydrotalea flava]NIO93143.1 ATP-binding cassette domain-containing protein [Hydrotalea flava]
MKRFSRILFYLSSQKKNIVLYVIFNLLSIVFSLVSLAMLAPFLQLLFGKEKLMEVKPDFSYSANGMLNYLKYILSQLIRTHSEMYALAFICIIIILSIFLKNTFIYLSYRVLTPMRNYVMTKLRSDLFAKILALPVGYFTEQRKGDIISRMSNDANEIEWSIIGTLEGLVKDPLNIIIILFTLVFLSPALSLFLLVLLPLTGFIIGRVSRSLKKQSTHAQEFQGTLMSILDETLGGLRIIKAFNAEKLIGSKFYYTNNKLNEIRNKMNFRRDLASPLSEFLGVIVMCCILWFGGRLVLGGKNFLQPDAFITYILFFTQIINPAKSLSTAFYNAQRGSSAIQRIEEILKAPISITEIENPIQFTEFKHQIEFKNVSFSYDEFSTLKNIHLTIRKGSTVAIVGSSGAGKSTFADLIPRFQDVSEGELLIDGINIKDYNLHSLRKHMGIVTQEPILFNDTIANNIALGTENATMEQIIEAAKIANAHQFILQKEEGYKTNIGDRGNKLSGGEKQRITIARAILRNPPILILDEATSSLDTESERLVQDAINNMMLNRTSIVIAHRLSTIKHADEIIVLDKGEIIERGTHQQLIELEGIYKKLVTMQEVH